MGDCFLYDTFTSYKAICTRATIENKQAPFMHDYYDVSFQFTRPLSGIKYVETRIYNAIVDEMNSNQRLPKYILIAIDKDLIESLKSFDFGAQILMEDAVSWLVEKLDKALYWRKEDIRSKKPGALTGPGEPRLIFINIIDRPRNTDPRKHNVFKLVSKANDAIEKVVHKYKRMYHIMYIESVNEFLHFDYQGHLTPNGRIQYWKEVDDKMRRFDKGQIDLNPKPEYYYPLRSARRCILKP